MVLEGSDSIFWIPGTQFSSDRPQKWRFWRGEVYGCKKSKIIEKYRFFMILGGFSCGEVMILGDLHDFHDFPIVNYSFHQDFSQIFSPDFSSRFFIMTYYSSRTRDLSNAAKIMVNGPLETNWRVLRLNNPPLMN